MKEKYKYLFRNTGYLFIGNFSSKILNFLLVPLYTYVLSTEEYGIYDVLYTTAIMLIPFLSCNIVDSIMRFSIDQSNQKKKTIYTIATKYTIIGGIAFSLGIIIVSKIFNIKILQEYLLQTILLFWTLIFSQNAVQMARGLEDVKAISIAGIIGTFSMVTFNILFLLVFRWGLNGYFYANILSMLAQILVYYFKDKLYLYIDMKVWMTDAKVQKEMLSYSLPLIFTTIGWYINGMADRYMVIYFEGLSANGIYSVSYKIPAVLNAIETIFIQSWQLSAVKELDTEEGIKFYNSIYSACQIVMLILSSGMIMLTRIAARILFSEDFYMAWIYVPTLIFYVLFNTLSGTIGGIFISKKDSKILASSTIIGAVINIFLNILLIYLMGTEGAALATAISSIVIWYLRYSKSKKYVSYSKSDFKRAIIGICILVFQALSMTLITDLRCYLIQIICLGGILLINYKEIAKWLKIK